MNIAEQYPTFEAFQERVAELFPDYDPKVIGSGETWCDPLVARWTTGGVTGGSCWDTKHYALEAEDEPKDTSLDMILREICPQITYLQYRLLEEHGVYEIENGSRNEYYGNREEYRIRRLNLKRLYDVLSEW